MAKGIYVYVLRPVGRDCTNNGISSQFDTFVLTGEGIDQHFAPSMTRPELKLVKRYFGSGNHPYYHAEPVEGKSPDAAGWMAGGNFIYTSDSRFRVVCDYPISVHDRQEF